jgi:uncharacterized damage-inducible protein DinB
MSGRERWFDRSFELGLAASAAPGLIARLRATPGRLERAVRDLPPSILALKPGGRWSIKENIGHLADLEPLWDQRLDDFERGAPVLAAADLQNRKTHEAGHNDRALDELLRHFRSARERCLARLERMDDRALAQVSKHPRLQQDMSVVDLCFFVAEHDDHHLQTIEEIARDLAR